MAAPEEEIGPPSPLHHREPLTSAAVELWQHRDVQRALPIVDAARPADLDRMPGALRALARLRHAEEQIVPVDVDGTRCVQREVELVLRLAEGEDRFEDLGEGA